MEHYNSRTISAAAKKNCASPSPAWLLPMWANSNASLAAMPVESRGLSGWFQSWEGELTAQSTADPRSLSEPGNEYPGSLENNCAIAAQKHALFEHEPQGPRQNDFFDIAPGACHVGGRVAVVDGNHVLSND